jgi:exonuclease III
MNNIPIIALFLSLFCNLVYTSDIECPYVNISTVKDRRIDKSKLRLVQYNVEWLFIDYCQSSDCPGNGCTWKNTSDAEKHLEYVSSVIKELNPDIINLCEVEGCDELSRIIQNLDTSYIPYLKKGTDSATGQNVGMITRVDPAISLYRTEEKQSYPIEGTKCGNTSVTGSTGVSKHYITEYILDGMNIAFIGAHLLAIPTDPSRCVEREAQSQILQNVIYDYIQKGYEIIFMGDLNDYDGEILDIGPNYPTSRVLDILKGIDGKNKGKYELINVASHITPPERYSDWWDSDKNCNTESVSDYSMIDHILVTNEINKLIVNVFIYHGYEEYCGKWNSDHYPVVIDFTI